MHGDNDYSTGYEESEVETSWLAHPVLINAYMLKWWRWMIMYPNDPITLPTFNPAEQQSAGVSSDPPIGFKEVTSHKEIVEHKNIFGVVIRTEEVWVENSDDTSTSTDDDDYAYWRDDNDDVSCEVYVPYDGIPSADEDYLGSVYYDEDQDQWYSVIDYDDYWGD